MFIDELIEGGEFRCYSDNLFTHSSDISPECDYLSPLFISDNNLILAKIYPNLSNGIFWIDLSKEGNIKEIQLTDLLGNLIIRKQVNYQKEISMENIREGAYLLKILGKDNKMIYKKIIIYQ